MRDKKSRYIRRWIRDLSKIRPELGNFSLCPFAAKSNFLIVEQKLDEIVPSPDYDVVINIVEDYHDSDYLYNAVDEYNLKYEDYKFIADHGKTNTFINKIQSNNGKYNLVLVQPRKDLTEARINLAKTSYYDYWDENYLKEVLEEDYDLIKSKINNHEG